MSNLLKSKFFLGVMMVVAFAFVAVSSASAAYMHTVTLKQGSSGSQVVALQQALGGLTADGSFGPMTKAAVMAFQSTNGLTADGVVGAMTGAKLAGGSTGSYPAGCTSTSGYSSTTGVKCDSSSTGTTPSTGDLEGTDGTISAITTLSQYSDEEVGEGESDVKVAGFELETSNDGDISLKSFKLVFDPTGNETGDSSHVDDYFDSVSIWMGSTKIGSADLADFSENSNDTYSKVVSVKNAVVRSDSTEKFYITVDGANSFDSGDINADEWSVGIENVRYEDGSGVVSTDSTSATRSADEIGWDSLGDGMEIDAVTFSASADTELKISTASDNPEEGIVAVSDTGTTDDVVLLSGKLKLSGTSDVTIDEFPVTFAAVTSNMNVVASNVRLVLGDKEFSEAVPSVASGASASITFDNLRFDVDAGDTVEFQVLVDVADASDFTEGASLTASVTSTNRSFIDVENEEGDQLASGEKTGTAGGETLSFRTTGIVVALVGSPTAVKGEVDADNGDTGTFVIRFKVTAVGDNVYVASIASPDGAMANTYSLTYGTARTATTTDQTGTLRNETDTDLTSEGVYLIEEGESETFELTVDRSKSDIDMGAVRVALTGIKWDTDNDSTPDITYSSNLDAFVTPSISLD